MSGTYTAEDGSIWPEGMFYRVAEVAAVTALLRGGWRVAVIGVTASGKSGIASYVRDEIDDVVIFDGDWPRITSTIPDDVSMVTAYPHDDIARIPADFVRLELSPRQFERQIDLWCQAQRQAPGSTKAQP